MLSDTVLSGHPLLSGQFSKSRKLLPLIYCFFDLYKWSPLSGCGHHLRSPKGTFSIVVTCIKQSHGVNYLLI